MQVTITAVGPDHRGLADPIVHFVTGAGANIHEIQMYDRDSERLFAMLMRIEWTSGTIADLRRELAEIGQQRGLQVRVWSRDEHARPPRLAICTTYRAEPPLAILRAVRDRRLKAEVAVMAGNRMPAAAWPNSLKCRGCPSEMIRETRITVAWKGRLMSWTSTT